VTAKKTEPWHPAGWDIADAAAIQALARGDASPDMQRRALRWVIEAASMTYDQTFVPGQADVSAFLEGRRSVGNQLVKLLKVNLASVKDKQPGTSPSTARPGKPTEDRNA
jgi:hypothetical protein